MIITLLANVGEPWAASISAEAQNRTLVLSHTDLGQALDFLWSVPVSVLVVSLEQLSRPALDDYQRLTAAAPQAVTVCLVSPAALAQVRQEALLSPDFWLPVEATPAELREVMNTAWGQALLRAESCLAEGGPGPAPACSAPEAISPESALFRRLMPALSSGFDTDRLLGTYVEAVAQFVRCTTHCLLWRGPKEEHFTVYTAQGLPPRWSARAGCSPRMRSPAGTCTIRAC